MLSGFELYPRWVPLNKIRKERPSKENELFINTLRDLFPTRGSLKIPMEKNFSVPCSEIMGIHQ